MSTPTMTPAVRVLAAARRVLAWAATPVVALAARRRTRREREEARLSDFIAALRAVASNQGPCAHCGKPDVALKADGRLWSHGHGCPGSGELPARVSVDAADDGRLM